MHKIYTSNVVQNTTSTYHIKLRFLNLNLNKIIKSYTQVQCIMDIINIGKLVNVSASGVRFQ